MKLKIILGVMLSVFITALQSLGQAYNWTVIAGFANSAGYADGTNKAAYFNNPQGMAVDGAGNVYVADANNYVIRKISLVGTNWVTTTIAGLAGSKAVTDGTNNAARFYSLASLQIDGLGNLYVQDSINSNYYIRKIAPVGTNWVVTTIYKLWAGGSGWAVDPSGTYYTSSNYAIIQLTPVVVNGILSQTNFVTTALAGFPGLSGSADGTNAVARFNSPTVFGIDSSSAIYLTDVANSTNTIRKVSPSGGDFVTTTIIAEPSGSSGFNFNYLNFDGSVLSSPVYIPASYYVFLLQPGITNGGLYSSTTMLGGVTAGADGTAYMGDRGASVIRQGVPNLPAWGGLQVALQPGNAVSAGAAWRVDAGLWQTNGATVTNLIAGSNHMLSFAPVNGWSSPSNQWVTISNSATTSVAAVYLQQFGAVQVNLTPSGATNAGAQWALDGGAWQNSGVVLSNLTLGAHTISYLPLSSWITPSNQVVNVVFGQTTNVTATYIGLGSLQVFITPIGAVSAGASWQLDGGAWQGSGSVVSNLVATNHTIAFTNIAGWTTPSNQAVTVVVDQTTVATGVYVQQFGNVQVVLSPAGAVSDGAQWQVDGGDWQASGTTLTNLIVGAHMVAFSATVGWTAPTNQAVNISSNQTTRLTAIYQGQGSLQVMVLPTAAIASGAQWQVDGGPWLSSGTAVSGLSRGAHIVSYAPASGWVAPAGQSVNVLANQLTVTNGLYTGLGYSFTTIAGAVGRSAYADGTNDAALFDTPVGICVDVSGNLYIADTGNSVIRKLTPATNGWVSSTIAGLVGHPGNADGANSQARFDYPSGVAVDTNGDLYVADQVNSTVRKLTTDGTNWTVSTIAGSAGSYGSANGTNGAARFYYPSGVAVDTAGNVYVADQINSTIRMLAPLGSDNGAVTTIAGIAGSNGSTDGTNNAARFYWPSDLTVDASGNILVADTFNDTIRKISPVGPNFVTTTIGGVAGVNGSVDGRNSTALFDGPVGIALDAFGSLFVADSYSSVVRKITPVGTNWVVNTIGGLAYVPGATDGTNSTARFDTPCGVCVGGNGVVYIADTYNQTIRAGSAVSPLAAGLYVGIAPTGKSVSLSWQAQADLIYQVEFKTNLLQAGWLNLGSPILATNRLMPFVDAPATNGQRFYRVKVLPP